MIYEAVLLAAIAFFAGVLFLFVSGGSEASGWTRLAQQAYLLAVFAAYFLWCWLRGGQTLAMKAWRIRLVAPGYARLPPARALMRFCYAAFFVGAFLVSILAAFAHRNPYYALLTLALTGVGLGWALVDKDRQFLHDRLAGTRLILVPA
jgi:uncharacterized RDD family membrane protein YckC